MRYYLLLVLLLSFGTIQAQRYTSGYFIQNNDTIRGYFNLIFKDGKLRSLESENGNRIDASVIQYVFHNGNHYQKISLPNQSTEDYFVQTLTGTHDQIQLAKNTSIRKKEFYLIDDNYVIKLSKERLNKDLAVALKLCEVISRSLSYRKIIYKQSDLISLMREYYDCQNEPTIKWQREDSVELNIAAKYFIHNSQVTAQQDKDYSGAYTDIVSTGLGFELELWANKKISGIVGFQAYDSRTTNFNADVTPFFDRSYRSEVSFSWENFEIPLTVKYNLDIIGFKVYLGVSSAIYLTKNLTVSENFTAPFFPQGTFINAPLNVDQQIALGGIAGIKKNISPNLSLSIDIRYLARALDFNLVRFDRNAINQAPIITTYKTGTLFIFSKPTDLTGFTFQSTELSFKISYRMFSDFKSF